VDHILVRGSRLPTPLGGRTPTRRPAHLVGALVAVLIASYGAFTPSRALATAGDPIRYAYDAAGRLTAAVDPAVGSASYDYDAAGNITGIDRTPVATLGVAGF
jgi:YD repeat-containing protein